MGIHKNIYLLYVYISKYQCLRLSYSALKCKGDLKVYRNQSYFRFGVFSPILIFTADLPITN